MNNNVIRTARNRSKQKWYRRAFSDPFQGAV